MSNRYRPSVEKHNARDRSQPGKAHGAESNRARYRIGRQVSQATEPAVPW